MNLFNRIIPLVLVGVMAAWLAAGPPLQAATPTRGPTNPVLSPTYGPQLADLMVDSISLSNPVKEGDKIGVQSIFNIVVKNTGQGASVDCKLKFTLTAVSGGPAPDELSGTLVCPALTSGQTVGLAWPGPSANTWSAGSYRLTVEVDSEKAVKEANDLNNVKNFEFRVAAKPAVSEAPFTPVQRTTGEISIIGKADAPFTPVKKTTDEIIIVGKADK